MVVYTFDWDWIKEKRKNFANPIRQMEKLVRDFEGATLIRSGSNSLYLDLETAKKDDFTETVVTYIRENLQENDPWKYMKVSGEAKERVRTDSEEKEQKAAGKQEQPESLPQDGAQEQAATAEKQSAQDSDSHSDSHRKQSEDKEGAEQETADKGKDEEAEEEFNLAQAAAESVQQLAATVPMRYSPEITAYIEELGKVIPMLSDMGQIDCLWAQNLLVSIDSGFGLSSVLDAIARMYAACRIAEVDYKSIREIVIGQPEGEPYKDWERAVALAREFRNANSKGERNRVILAMDISQWQKELGKQEVKGYLRQLNDLSKTFTCVFRIPFIEQQIIEQNCDAISDVMPVNMLVAAPLSVVSMVDYIKYRMESSKCFMSDDCDGPLEQWIMKEKSDDSFFGYKTLNKMVQQLIYKKALLNCEEGVVSSQIDKEDIIALIEKPEDNIEDPYKMLDHLIGIAKVKQKVREIVVQIKTQQELQRQGKEIEKPSIHMIFTGNPGTGKTTVARILAKLLKEEGVLRKGHFYEIQGRNLCGRYVGETAPKTSTYCRDAYGSVLFIDEAYSLNQGGQGSNDYGREAVTTLMAEMENHRDDFCVILAGYKDEMENLKKANPGLESRVPFVIDFPNYSREELEQIFFQMLDGTFAYEDSLREAVRSFLYSIPKDVMEDKSFSNARLVRNLYERAWGKAAYRRRLSGEKDLEIRKEDLHNASEESEFQELLGRKGHRIGFV